MSTDIRDGSRDELLTGRQVAQMVGIAYSTWRDYVADGRAPAADQAGRPGLWWRSTVERWMRSGRPGQGVGGGRPRRRH